MKKKVILGLVIFMVFYILAGCFLVWTIDITVQQYQHMAIMHEVESLRRNLRGRMIRVQNNIKTLETKFKKTNTEILADLEDLYFYASKCISCHHKESLQNELTEINKNVEVYIEDFKTVLKMKDAGAFYQPLKHNTYAIGNNTLQKIEKLSQTGKKSLDYKTYTSLSEIMRYKILANIIIFFTPIVFLLLGIFIVLKIIKPMNSLLEGVKKLKKGDFQYKFDEKLPDEFGILASSFNELISELTFSMYKINESEQKYKLLFNSAADAIFLIDAEGQNIGNIVDANPAAAVMHGYTIEEVCSMNIKDLDVLEDALKSEDRIKRLIDEKSLFFTVEHYKKDGSIFPLEVTANLIELSGHKYVLAIDRDISFRKQAEERLQRAEQLKLCGEISTGLAHEIKNPLAGIKASMEVLIEDNSLSQENKKTLSMVIKEVKRIENLIKDLLLFARPSKPQLTRLDLHAAIEKVLTLAQNSPQFMTSEQTSIDICRNYDVQMPNIQADPNHLHQILLNLLINAAEAMPDGGVIGIATHYQSQHGYVDITISDTGCALDEALIDDIFKPFYTSKLKGTGLGLSISRRLAEENGGTLFAFKSNDGLTNFVFRLLVEKGEPV